MLKLGMSGQFQGLVVKYLNSRDFSASSVANIYLHTCTHALRQQSVSFTIHFPSARTTSAQPNGERRRRTSLRRIFRLKRPRLFTPLTVLINLFRTNYRYYNGIHENAEYTCQKVVHMSHSAASSSRFVLVTGTLTRVLVLFFILDISSAGDCFF